jgi:hypothetical protein
VRKGALATERLFLARFGLEIGFDCLRILQLDPGGWSDRLPRSA